MFKAISHSLHLLRSSTPTSRQWATSSGSRRSLVTQISPTTSLLRAEHTSNEVYLLGTAHISEASANEVIQLVDQIKPDTVFLELDPPRAARLRHSSTHSNNDDADEAMFLQGIQRLGAQSGGGGMPFGEEMLKTFFRKFYGILKRYGYVPGIEMLAAMKEAERIGAKLEYGDRDIHDTIRELSGALNPSLIMKASTIQPPTELQEIFQNSFQGGGGGGGGLEGLGDTVEAMKTREHARMMTTWMDQALPPITEVMLHRRDKVMAENLRKNCGQGKVLAVVGMAHMDGVEREWAALEGRHSMLS